MSSPSSINRTSFNPSELIVPLSAESAKESFVVEGPYGTGKSTFLGSVAKVVGAERTLLVATHARELNSWLYKELSIPYLLIEDTDWKPSLGSYVATGFGKLLQTIEWLREEDDQYDAVLVDSGTEMSEQAWHLALAPHGVTSPSEMDGQSRWGPYETLDTLMDQGIKGLVSLTRVAKRPKHIGISWHVQPPKDDTVDVVTKVKKESADHAGKGIEYEGDVLPMVRGRFRRRVGQHFGAVIFTDIQIKYIEGKGMEPLYRLQVRPNQERHTKLPGPLPSVSYIPNDFRAFLSLLSGEIPPGATETASAAPSIRRKLSRK